MQSFLDLMEFQDEKSTPVTDPVLDKYALFQYLFIIMPFEMLAVKHAMPLIDIFYTIWDDLVSRLSFMF